MKRVAEVFLTRLHLACADALEGSEGSAYLGFEPYVKHRIRTQLHSEGARPLRRGGANDAGRTMNHWISIETQVVMDVPLGEWPADVRKIVQ